MGLLLHSLTFLARLLSLGPLYYFVGLWTIIPTILTQWSLLYYFLSPPFSYYWVSSAIRPFCQKWASTFSLLSILIASMVHMRIRKISFLFFFFASFLNNRPRLIFFLAILFEFGSGTSLEGVGRRSVVQYRFHGGVIAS